MAKYWVYINDQVQGPYAIDDLVRLRGFSRQTMVCEDDLSGQPTRWISPAQIPELAPIFKAVEQIYDPSVPLPVPAPVVKPARKQGPPRFTPVVYPMVEKNNSAWIWLILPALIAGAVGWRWYGLHQAAMRIQQRASAQAMIEDYAFPSTSLYGSLRHYFTERSIAPKWKFESGEEGTQIVTVSWPPGSPAVPPTELPLYTIEVNLQAQSLHGMNSAAMRLLSEGFPPSPASSVAPRQSPKPVADLLASAIEGHCKAVNAGDYGAVWRYFSQQKRDDMIKAGMSESGFERIQQLTHSGTHAVDQTILKTKKESDKLAWVLVREVQKGQSDLFIKQRWIDENGEWKLDDEEKRMATDKSAIHAASEASPSDSHAENSAPPSTLSLPGVSPSR